MPRHFGVHRKDAIPSQGVNFASFQKNVYHLKGSAARGTKHEAAMETTEVQLGLQAHAMFDAKGAGHDCTLIHSAPSATRRASVGGEQPTGHCCVGVPVVIGNPAAELPTGKELFHVLMSFVARDDYHSITELARRGGASVDFKRKCGFTVALRPETSCLDENFPRQLRVCGANLLHYAVCISSFRAALALLVACPALLQSKCTVVAGQFNAEQRWAASELVRIFVVLYQDGDGNVSETAAIYNSALPLLEIGERDYTKLPFLGLPSMAQRIAAAGCDDEAVIAAFIAAVAHQVGQDRGDQEICDETGMPVSDLGHMKE
jgi:hypothetical protein